MSDRQPLSRNYSGDQDKSVSNGFDSLALKLQQFAEGKKIAKKS